MAETLLGREVQNVSVLVAIGVSTSGFREIFGVAEGSREVQKVGGNFFGISESVDLNR